MGEARTGFPPSSSRGQALRGKNGWGCGNEGREQVSNMPLWEEKYRYYVGGTGGSRTAPTRNGGTLSTDGGCCGQDWGMDSRLRLHGGRLCAGTTERGVLRAGLGDGFPPPSSRGRALRGNNGWGCGNEGRVNTRRGKFETCPYVRGSIGIMWGGRAVREPPLRRGRKDGWWADGVAGRIGGWIPAFVFTREGSAREQRVGMWE